MRALSWVLTLVVTLALGVAHAWRDRRTAREGIVLYSTTQSGCPIVVPRDASEGERLAAATVRATLAQAAGSSEGNFPILEERGAIPRRAVLIGRTRRGRDLMQAAPKPPFDTGVAFFVRGGALFLRGERREAVESAVGWFLETQLGAHWFMPGPLGACVPKRSEFALPASDGFARPGFISRELLSSGAGAREWHGRNRLENRFDHGHNLVTIFSPADLRRSPEMAPMRTGQRFIPTTGDQNWQPDLLSPAAVEHAATAAIRAFDADPNRLSFSLSINDSVRYDDSAATLAAVTPPRYFRHRPDYSNLVFRFTNAVADRVARPHPDRWLPAYAYYWCENAPDFSVARNVVPFLTADRSQWSHPEFAAEDRALIERWCRSGAAIVGAYDYFYGAPFLSPRPTLYALAESIPFQHRAGVRAFFAEASPNWALDGPKPWLAAQLLWASTREAGELLDIYYREFWAEAAAPMREFFAVADRTWQEQPGPALWLRFYQDEDQGHVYPMERRAELKLQLERAIALARSESVRARVALVATGYSVTEAFWAFSAAREHASRVSRGPAEPAQLMAAWLGYRQARTAFERRYGQVRREQPLALASQNLEVYLRNQPDSRLARALSRTEAGRTRLRESPYLMRTYAATHNEIARVTTHGMESLQDPLWSNVTAAAVGGSADLEWTAPGGAWRGTGEPWEGRAVQLAARADGERVLRLAGCRTEGIGQWVSVTPGALYAAQVKVRAKSSPGTATFLLVTFLDDKGRHIGIGRADRLAPDEAVQETELCVIVRAPPHARFIGFGLRVLNQINDDFAEFSRASLRRLVE